jgi:DNA polymerase II small subunit
MNKEILNFCLEKGLLLDKEVLNLFNETQDLNLVKIIIENIKNTTKTKIINKSIFYQNKEQLEGVFSTLSKGNKENFENFKIKLGLNIEISTEKSVILDNIEKKVNLNELSSDFIQKDFKDLKIFSNFSKTNKKIEVSDFVKYFRGRFNEIRNILQEHSELNSLTSINKISNNRQGFSIIGIVYDKRVTKNKNIILEVEDLTGKTKVLINNNKKELYKKAEEITLDSVIGFKVSGNREILFANDLIFPESILFERKKSSIEEYALFIGDLHFGSKLFLEKNFLKFIDYLNGNISDNSEVSKIKYLFIVGDILTGVGNYPNQEKDLNIKDLEEQFIKLTEILSTIRKDIRIIISPGNHDGVRLIEPQPLFDKKYAWPLYNLENVILTENPCSLNIGIKKDFSGFNVLTYHGFSFPFYANNISKLMLKKAMNSPEEIMKYLLKNRHLAPTHTSVQYFPLERDPLIIREVPDIFVAAHTHKSAVTYYNNVLVISTSCWEAMTPYQEKFGNKPDHCKVPMINLKTREVKILDFE